MMLQLKRADAFLQSQQIVGITPTIIILLYYLDFYYAYGAGKVPSEQKKKDFSHQKSH